jgi:hypothetical protein
MKSLVDCNFKWLGFAATLPVERPLGGDPFLDIEKSPSTNILAKFSVLVVRMCQGPMHIYLLPEWLSGDPTWIKWKSQYGY